MTVEQRIEETTDQFPVGMRVLAVDDDPTCLLLLERLLRKCKYHVTTRTHAIAALNLLRENKNRFDLVISDVHMPDMDGFKLLELVGLEMDLPVIMLSANGDPKLVMKGITHGACDYLLKPVRIEELQIIWQHVVRKKKVDPKDKMASENCHKGSSEGGAGNGQSDQKHNKKRKDQVEDEDEDNDENGEENDDPSAPKKPRVVWSIELHRKFVAAVNHLGVDKAVPKRILELMNVEKLTRENVASHLQKYRLYLRRISCVQSQQTNMVAAFGNTDPVSYTRISSFNSMGGFNHLSGSPHFQNDTFRSFQPNALLGRLNSPANLGIQPHPSINQANHSQLSVFADRSSTLLPRNSNGCILKGMPMSFEFDQTQNHGNTSVNQIGELPTKVADFTIFPVSSGLPDAKPTIATLNSSHFTPLNNPLMLQGHPVQAHSRIGIGNQQSSATLASISSGLSSHFSDRAIDHWPVAVQSSAVQSNSYAPYSGGQLISTNLNEGSSINELPLSVTDYQYEGADSINIRQKPNPLWDNFIPDPINSSNLCNAATTPAQITDLRTQQGIVSEFNASNDQSYVDYSSLHNSLVDNSGTNIPVKQEYQFSDGEPLAYQLPNTVGSLEDLVSSMMK